MTLLPIDSWSVKGVEGAGYVLNAECAAPDCDLITGGERHHLWRRSFLIGDYWWVELPDGRVIGNCIALCHEHHRQVTKGIVRIEYDGEFFYWHVLAEDDMLALRWQPPAHPEGEIYDSKPPGKKGAVCPSCGQALPHPKHDEDKPLEKKRVRKSWSIAVPVDEQENGAELLDAYLETIRQLFGEAGLPYGNTESAKYFPLSNALALFITNADQILDEGGG